MAQRFFVLVRFDTGSATRLLAFTFLLDALACGGQSARERDAAREAQEEHDGSVSEQDDASPSDASKDGSLDAGVRDGALRPQRDSASALDAQGALDVARASEAGPLEGGAPDAHGAVDSGTGASIGVPSTIGGLTPVAWLEMNCLEIASTPLGPFNLSHSLSGGRCPAMPPFTSLVQARAMGCTLGIIPNRPEDKNADGLTQRVSFWDGGYHCDGEANLSCNGVGYSWTHASLGVDSNETVIRSGDCVFRVHGSESKAFTASTAHEPALKAYCKPEEMNQPLALKRYFNAPPDCPETIPFRTPDEARAAGCTAVDATDAPHYSGGLGESAGGCTISQTFQCGAQHWTWRRMLSVNRVEADLVLGDLPEPQTSEQCKFTTYF